MARAARGTPAGLWERPKAAGARRVAGRAGGRALDPMGGGYLRLDGRRVFLRWSHTGNATPAAEGQVSIDPDQLRRDLVNVKAMGFNAIRFIAGMANRYQLDLCDEMGLMVYEECLAAW